MASKQIADVKVSCDQYQRFLSPMEDLCYRINSNDPQEGTYVQVTVLESQQDVPHGIVRKALQKLSSYHYLLQARIANDEEGNLKYSPIENIDKEGAWIRLELLTASNVDDWKRIMVEDFKKPLDFETGPLWRAKWITCPSHGGTFSYVFILVAFHAVMDGKVAVDLSTNQFLTLLQVYLKGGEVSEQSPKPIFFTYPSDGIFLNVPNCTEVPVKDYPVPWYVRMGCDAGLWVANKVMKTREKPLDHEALVNKDCDAFYTFEIDSETSTKLCLLSKREQVTIHSLFLVLLGNALKSAEKEGVSVRPLNKIMYPIDLRKFNTELKTQPLTMGCFTSSGSHSVKYHDIMKHGSFFKYVRAVNKSVKSNNKVSASPILLSTLVHVVKRGKFQQLVDICDDAITLSNAGDFDNMVRHKMESESTVKVRAQYYTVSHGRFFLTTSTLNKQMFFCVSYDPTCYTENMIEFVANDIKNAVQTLVDRLDNE